nr:MAG TPA_asm: hypothetical protein [Bacteriophage sp.]
MALLIDNPKRSFYSNLCTKSTISRLLMQSVVHS